MQNCCHLWKLGEIVLGQDMLMLDPVNKHHLIGLKEKQEQNAVSNNIANVNGVKAEPQASQFIKSPMFKIPTQTISSLAFKIKLGER